MYKATIEREKIALIACSPAKTSRPSRIAKPQVNHTVLTGVPVNPFILYNHPENGRAPSRAKAKDCLDAAKTYTHDRINFRPTLTGGYDLPYWNPSYTAQ